MLKKLSKVSLSLTALALLSYTLSPAQSKENLTGLTLALKNSARAAYILYLSKQDYELSLNHIPYNTEEYHLRRSEVHLRVANRILELSKENKGIYLKLGQYLGNLDGVVPWEFPSVLRVLQDSAPFVSYEEMKVVLETDLGVDPSEIFS